MLRNFCRTSSFSQFLRQTQILILEISNVFLWLKFSPSLNLNKIEHSAKVSLPEDLYHRAVLNNFRKTTHLLKIPASQFFPLFMTLLQCYNDINILRYKYHRGDEIYAVFQHPIIRGIFYNIMLSILMGQRGNGHGSVKKFSSQS